MQPRCIFQELKVMTSYKVPIKIDKEFCM